MATGIYTRTKEMYEGRGEKIAKIRRANNSHRHSEESKKRIGIAGLGRIPWNKGRRDLPKPSIETRRKMSEANRGEKSHLWRGGLTSINMKIRTSFEFKLWREAVFTRDNWTCVWCGVRGGKLNADHIKPFSLFPELRFAIDNGRTLCLDCHKKTDTYLSKIFKYKND